MDRKQQSGEFEKLVAKFHTLLDDKSKVTPNVNVKGKSGRQREIDVLIEKTSGLYTVKIVIECKYWGRKVGIAVVDGFATKLEDVGGHYGVIVSSSGFDSGAIAQANAKNIKLIDFREASEFEWSNYFKHIIVLRAIEYYLDGKVSFIKAPTIESMNDLELQDGRPLFINSNGDELTDVDILQSEWVSKRIPLQLGQIQHHVDWASQLSVRAHNGLVHLDGLVLKTEILARGHEGVVGLIQGYVIQTSTDQSVMVETETLSAGGVARNWPSIDLIDNQAIAEFNNRPLPESCFLIQAEIA